MISRSDKRLRLKLLKRKKSGKNENEVRHEEKSGKISQESLCSGTARKTGKRKVMLSSDQIARSWKAHLGASMDRQITPGK